MKSLEKRMKRYEVVSDHMLPIRMPVIIRLDGWHFKTFTKGLEKPFDLIFRRSMLETTQYLCNEVPGTVLGYTQSDEISLLICDYKNLEAESWFDNRTNKLVSIPAGMAAIKFNETFKSLSKTIEDSDKIKIYENKYNKGIFDARAFVVPEDDVVNYFYWRQKDAIRNSIESVGQTYIGHKKLHKKNNEEIHKMLEEKGIFWDDYEKWLTRGACVYKSKENGKKQEWKIDKEIPIFKDEDRIFISRWIPE